MNTLSSELTRFMAAIAGGDAPSQNQVAGEYYPVELAIDVYRNNYSGNLHDALAGAYPVIKKLVGDPFFRRLTHTYIEQYPSHSGNLHQYGEQFSVFIATFEPAKHLEYLSDVATLEWAAHCAYFAEDAGEFQISKLVEIPAERYGDLVFRTHPATHVLRSRFPVADIWLAHQPGASDDFHIDISRGPCVALVSRHNNEVLVRELASDEAEWLSALLDGEKLQVATDRTLAKNPKFELVTALARLVTQGIFCGADLQGET